MHRDDCLREATPGEMSKGESVRQGRFVRNLKRKEVSKRYPQDADDRPLFGYRVKWPVKWRAEEQCEGISVNDQSCLPELGCAIRLHPNAEQYRHVVMINLEALSKDCGYSVIAIYDPIADSEDNRNPCHFNLVPEREPLDDFIMALRDRLADPFPKKWPRTKDDVRRAEQAQQAYEAVFSIKCDILGSKWPPAKTEVRSDTTPPASPVA